ncbi:MAG: DivIVA domain-containing protein [Gemmatimonadetes bacterium]|nr:DivIVA domain-containing protein [Gemmatimonadota bacterium]
MIDLTPLDVRKKKGDFRRAMRGYEPALVDDFLDLVAERLEELVRENMGLRERAQQINDSLAAFKAREAALNDALVSAQQLREEMRSQATREADLALREARTEADRLMAEAKREVATTAEGGRRLVGQRARYLRSFRSFVEQQLGELELEENRLREQHRGSAAEEPVAEVEGKKPSTRSRSTPARNTETAEAIAEDSSTNV